MSWVAVAVGFGSAAVSAYGSYQNNRTASRANRGAGAVDITHQTDPWGPSADDRQSIMDEAQRLYGQGGNYSYGGGPPGWGGGSGGAGGGGGKNRGKNRGGGGGGRGGRNAAAAPVNSAQSQQLSVELQNRAQNGSPLYNPANQYTIDTLNGTDHDPYRSQAFDQNQQWINMLFGGQGLGGDSGGMPFGSYGGGGGGGSSFNYSSGGGVADAPVGAAGYAKDILNGKYLNEGNPFRQQLLDSMTKRIKDDFASQTLPGINSQFGGAGAVGSEAMNDAYRKAAQGFGDSLSGATNQVMYTDYNNRMEDVMHALDTGAGLDENAADNAQRAAAASASAGASAYGADRSAATQLQLARMSALENALGLSASMGSDFGGDQRNALNDVPELSGLDLRDLSTAFGASHSMDELSEQERTAARSAGLQARGLNMQNQAQRFGQWQYLNNLPFQQLGSWADLVNAMSSGYGTSTEQGTDRRNASPMPYSNTFGQAVAGGLGGYQYAQQQGWGGAGSAYPNQSQNPFYYGNG